VVPRQAADFQLVRPGFGFITGFAKSLVGFDPGFILNLGLLLAARSTVFHYTREFVYSIASSYCIRTVEVEGSLYLLDAMDDCPSDQDYF